MMERRGTGFCEYRKPRGSDDVVEGEDILFKAFQIPGCVKEIKPTMMTLNNGLRYHLVHLPTGFCTANWSSSRGIFSASVFTEVWAVLESLSAMLREGCAARPCRGRGASYMNFFALLMGNPLTKDNPWEKGRRRGYS